MDQRFEALQSEIENLTQDDLILKVSANEISKDSVIQMYNSLPDSPLRTKLSVVIEILEKRRLMSTNETDSGFNIEGTMSHLSEMGVRHTREASVALREHKFPELIERFEANKRITLYDLMEVRSFYEANELASAAFGSGDSRMVTKNDDKRGLSSEHGIRNIDVRAGTTFRHPDPLAIREVGQKLADQMSEFFFSGNYTQLDSDTIRKIIHRYYLVFQILHLPLDSSGRVCGDFYELMGQLAKKVFGIDKIIVPSITGYRYGFMEQWAMNSEKGFKQMIIDEFKNQNADLAALTNEQLITAVDQTAQQTANYDEFLKESLLNFTAEINDPVSTLFGTPEKAPEILTKTHPELMELDSMDKLDWLSEGEKDVLDKVIALTQTTFTNAGNFDILRIIFTALERLIDKLMLYPSGISILVNITKRLNTFHGNHKAIIKFYSESLPSSQRRSLEMILSPSIFGTYTDAAFDKKAFKSYFENKLAFFKDSIQFATELYSLKDEYGVTQEQIIKEPEPDFVYDWDYFYKNSRFILESIESDLEFGRNLVKKLVAQKEPQDYTTVGVVVGDSNYLLEIYLKTKLESLHKLATDLKRVKRNQRYTSEALKMLGGALILDMENGIGDLTDYIEEIEENEKAKNLTKYERELKDFKKRMSKYTRIFVKKAI